MVKYVEPQVFLIGQTQANEDIIEEWLDYIEVEDAEKYIFNTTNGFELPEPELIVALAAKRCYMSFEPGLNPNVTKIRQNWHDYLENILKQHHGSCLEHSVFNFAIEDVSRVITAELNRHRAGVAISEGSQRYIKPNTKKDGIRFVRLDSLQDHNTLLGDDKETGINKMKTALVIQDTLHLIESKYKELEAIWDMDNIESFALKKKLTSLFRTILPQGIATGGVWSFNLRALRHVVAMRSSPHAEEGIAKLAGLLGKEMVENLPNLACDFEMKDGFWVPIYEKV